MAFYDAPGKPQNAAEWRAKLAEPEGEPGAGCGPSLLRARLSELKQQLDQVQHVDGAVEVAVLHLAFRSGR